MNYNSIAENLDRMAVQHQTMVEAAKAFRALDSIEQVTQEAEARRESAIKERAKAEAELDAVVDKIADAKNKVNTLLADADTTSADSIAEGEAEAKRLIEDARASAAVMVANAKEQAGALISKVEADLAGKRSQFAVVSAEVVALNSKRDALVADTDKAQSRYDAVQEQIKKLAGG